MDRSQFLGDLNDYLDGAAGEDKVAALEAAVRENPAYREMAIGYALQDAMLEDLLEPVRPLSNAEVLADLAQRKPELAADLATLPKTSPAKTAGATRANKKAKPRRKRTAHHSPVRSSPWPFVAALASAAVLAVAVWLFLNRGQEPPQEIATPEKDVPAKTPEKAPEPEAPKAAEGPILAIGGGGLYTREGNTVKTDHRSSVDVELTDGSKVTMGPSSIVAFGDPTGEVRQDLAVTQGKLTVQAAKGGKTFRMKVGKSTLTVLGTRFIFHVPPRERIEGAMPSPARIEVHEGRVRVENEHGHRVLEPGGPSVVLCDQFEPAPIFQEQREFHGFSGRISALVLAVEHEGMLVKVLEAATDGENKLKHAKDRLTGKILWLQPMDGEDGERALKLMREARVMNDVGLVVWFGKQGRLVFNAPK